MIKNVIFDLDGTLVDSAPDIIETLSQAYRQVCPTIRISISRSIIGPPLSEMIKILTPDLDDQTQQKIIAIFRMIYDSSEYPKTKPYPGIISLLKLLGKNKCRIFLVTNKPSQPTKQILEKLKLKKFFVENLSADSLPGKKKAEKEELIEFLIEKYDLKSENSIVVGDTIGDFACAEKNVLDAVSRHLWLW